MVKNIESRSKGDEFGIMKAAGSTFGESQKKIKVDDKAIEG